MTFIALACLIFFVDQAVARAVRRVGWVLRVLVLASILSTLYFLTR